MLRSTNAAPRQTISAIFRRWGRVGDRVLWRSLQCRRYALAGGWLALRPSGLPMSLRWRNLAHAHQRAPTFSGNAKRMAPVRVGAQRPFTTWRAPTTRSSAAETWPYIKSRSSLPTAAVRSGFQAIRRCHKDRRRLENSYSSYGGCTNGIAADPR